MYHHEIIDISEDAFPFKVILHHNNNDVVSSIPKHWHRSFEVSYTCQGSIESFIINGKIFQTHPGDILLINPNEVHAIELSKKNQKNNIALTLLFPFDFMEQEINEFSQRHFYQPNELTLNQEQKLALLKCQSSLSNIVEEILQPTSFYRLVIMTNIYQFLYLITKEFSTLENHAHIWHSKADLDQMTDIITYIENHSSETLSISKLAESFHLSEGYFSRFFKKYMNMSVMSYVQEIRLHNAHQLLLNTDLSLSLISDRTGFPSTKSLTHVFKAKYDTTPAQYRLKNKYVSK